MKVMTVKLCNVYCMRKNISVVQVNDKVDVQPKSFKFLYFKYIEE